MRRALDLALEQGLGRETAVIHNNLAGVVGCRGATGPLDALSEEHRLLRAARHDRVALQSLRQPRLSPSSDRPSRRSPRSGRSPTACKPPATWRPRCAGWSCGCSPSAADRARPRPRRCSPWPATSAYRSSRPCSRTPPSSCSPSAKPSRRRRSCTSSTSSPPGADLLPGAALLLRVVLALDDAARRTARPPASTRSRHLTRRSRRPRPARRSRRPPRRGRALRGCGRALVRVRQRARARLRPARPGPLPGCARQARSAEPLREARELFASMGYKPALAETDALLAETAAA